MPRVHEKHLLHKRCKLTKHIRIDSVHLFSSFADAILFYEHFARTLNQNEIEKKNIATFHMLTYLVLLICGCCCCYSLLVLCIANIRRFVCICLLFFASFSSFSHFFNIITFNLY